MAREYFCAYHSYLKSCELLNDAELGRLFRACLQYSMTGAELELRGNERFVWPTIQQQIDRDKERYDDYCEKQSVNGAKGGRPKKTQKPKKPNGFFENPKNPTVFLETQKSQDKDKDKGEGEGKDNGKDEGELDRTPACDPAVAAVVSDYMNRINPSASRYSLEMLTEYAKTLGPDVCKRAFDIALDAKAANWNYIRAILQKWASLGVKCLADIDKLDKKRSGRTSDGKRELDDDEVAAIQRMMSGGDGG